MSKVIFLCGSPKKKTSVSLSLAKILAKFLDYDCEFVELNKSYFSYPLKKQEKEFLEIIEKVKQADCIVWVFGVYLFFAPSQMQIFIEKLFANNYYFKNKITAIVSAAAQIKDDYALGKMKFVVEQLGLSHVGEVIMRSSLFGYSKNKIAEKNCYLLAQDINWALKNKYIPIKTTYSIAKKYLFPTNSSKKIILKQKSKEKDKTRRVILMIVSSDLQKNVFAKSLVAAFKVISKYKIEVLELRKYNINPCLGCRRCFFNKNNICIKKDDYNKIINLFSKSAGVVFVSDCSCGIVDSCMKVFLERGFMLGKNMTFKEKHTMVVVSGGGPLNLEGISYLQDSLNTTTFCVTGISDTNIDKPNYVDTLVRTIKFFDRAIQEDIQKTVLFTDKGIRLIFRDDCFELAAIFEESKNQYIKNAMFDYPKTKRISEIIKMGSKDPAIKTKLVSLLKNVDKRQKNWQKKILKQLFIYFSN